MLNLSRSACYALQAAIQLAADDSSHPVPCSRLAAAGHMPERFLLQVLRTLVTHGILKSTRGVEGGYQLDKSPDEISVLEIVEAVEGPLQSQLPGDSLAEFPQQQLATAMQSLAEISRRQLDQIKLRQLLPPPGRDSVAPADVSPVDAATRRE